MRVETVTDVEVLRPLLEEWFDEQRCNDFGVEIDLESSIESLKTMLDLPDFEIISLWDDGPVGFMTLMVIPSWWGTQKIAQETYWYVRKDSRGCGLRLIRLAKKWAAENGCSHLVMGVSSMASDLRDRTCQVFERLGFRLFDSTFILEV